MSDRHCRRAVFCGFGALAAGACLALGSVPGTFDRTLPVSGAVSLDVRSDRGGLIITAGSSSSVRVRAIIKPLFGRVDLDLAEANIRALEKSPPIEQSGNNIRIGYVKDPGLLRAVSIRFEIETPRTTEVRAFTESGGIRIEGVAGPVETTTGSGRTGIRDIAAEIRVIVHSGAVIVRNAGDRVSVRSQSGGIQLTGVRGAVAAHNGSGSIEALELGGPVEAETQSGAIRISQVSAAPIRARSGSGSLKVRLAGGSGYQIDALSGSGKVTAPATIMPRRSKDTHSLKAQLGAGGPLVDLDTRSSSIVIQ